MSVDGMDSFLASQHYVTVPTLQGSCTTSDATEPATADSARASIDVSILEALDAVQLSDVELRLASANDLHYIEQYVYGLADHVNEVDAIHVNKECQCIILLHYIVCAAWYQVLSIILQSAMLDLQPCSRCTAYIYYCTLPVRFVLHYVV